MAQLVEHHLAKVRVAGSSPVVRSIKCFGWVKNGSAVFVLLSKPQVLRLVRNSYIKVLRLVLRLLFP